MAYKASGTHMEERPLEDHFKETISQLEPFGLTADIIKEAGNEFDSFIRDIL